MVMNIDAEHVLTSRCRGTSQQRNVNVVTVYDIQNKFIGMNIIIYYHNLRTCSSESVMF